MQHTNANNKHSVVTWKHVFSFLVWSPIHTGDLKQNPLWTQWLIHECHRSKFLQVSSSVFRKLPTNRVCPNPFCLRVVANRSRKWNFCVSVLAVSDAQLLKWMALEKCAQRFKWGMHYWIWLTCSGVNSLMSSIKHPASSAEQFPVQVLFDHCWGQCNCSATKKNALEGQTDHIKQCKNAIWLNWIQNELISRRSFVVLDKRGKWLVVFAFCEHVLGAALVVENR